MGDLIVTAEEKLAETISAIEGAGGVILTVTALAHPDTPHDVAAHRLTVGARSRAAAVAVAQIQADTEIRAAGLIPWTPETETEEGDV